MLHNIVVSPHIVFQRIEEGKTHYIYTCSFNRQIYTYITLHSTIPNEFQVMHSQI